MRIVLNNLIGNALKYHRNSMHQYIDIKVKYLPHHSVQFSIEDNGQGIAENQVSRIFDMFYRATSNSEGSGLGLYIVKSMIEKMNGKVEVISTLNSGSKFIITLPGKQ